MSELNTTQDFYWHESAGARILLPSDLAVSSPFPELCAKTKQEDSWVLVTITSSRAKREEMERMLQRLRLGNNQITVEIAREGAVNLPYRGVECVAQRHYMHMPVSRADYLWGRLLDLDVSSGVSAIFTIQGPGLFRNVESVWQKVMDSFSWNSDWAQVLAFDGDEIVFRMQYAPKKQKPLGPQKGPQLPSQLSYLQPVMDNLMALPPGQADEGFDSSLLILAELVKQRLQGLSDEGMEERIDEDCRALTDWMDEDRDNRSIGEYISGFLRGFQLFGEMQETCGEGVVVQRIFTTVLVQRIFTTDMMERQTPRNSGRSGVKMQQQRAVPSIAGESKRGRS